MKLSSNYEMGFFAPGFYPVGKQFAPAIGCFAGLPTNENSAEPLFIMFKATCCLPDRNEATFIAERDYHSICDDYEEIAPSEEKFLLFQQEFKKYGYVMLENK